MTTEMNLYTPVRALTAAVIAAVIVIGATSAQTPQPAPPAQQAPSIVPMQGMEHGRQMREMGQKAMQHEPGLDSEHAKDGEQGKDSGHAGMQHGPMGSPPCGPSGQGATSGTNCR